MSITIGSNIASLRGIRQLADTSNKLASVFERLSSGQRINRASDDAAGLSVAESLAADNRVYTQAIRNVQDGISVTTIMSSAISELQSITTRIAELAEQSANGTYSSQQRGLLDNEARALVDEYNRITATTEFNGRKLFDEDNPTLSIQAGYGMDAYISEDFGVPVVGLRGTGSFSFSTTVVTPHGDRSHISADINNDGILDIVAGSASSTFSSHLGNADGTFAQAGVFSAGMGLITVLADDVNGDGNVDVLGTTSGVGSELTVMLGNGDGNFQAAVTYSLGRIEQAELADMNNDGILDVVASNTGIRIAYGNGDGTFGNYPTWGPGITGNYIAIGDFNADGVLDVVGSSTNLDEVEFYMGNGDGTFWTAPGSFFDLSGGPEADEIVSADFDGDGFDDAAVIAPGETSAIIFYSNGDGSFNPGLTVSLDAVSISSYNKQFKASDFNNDGLADLALVAAGSTYIYLNAGDGSFSPAVQTPSTGTGNLVLEDFNNDGVIDISVASADIRVFFANTEPATKLNYFDLSTQESSRETLDEIDSLNLVLSQYSSKIGAFEQRLLTTSSVLESTVINLAEAESRIRDVDMAQEVAELTRLSILQQAGAAVLAQANLQPEIALNLIR